MLNKSKKGIKIYAYGKPRIGESKFIEGEYGMLKSVYYNGNSLAFVGSTDSHVAEQRVKMMISPLPEGYKLLYQVDMDKVDKNIKINLRQIRAYYMNKYDVGMENVREYMWR